MNDESKRHRAEQMVKMRFCPGYAVARTTKCKFDCNSCEHVIEEEVPAWAVPVDAVQVVPPGRRLAVKAEGHIERMSVQTIDDNGQVTDERKLIVDGERVADRHSSEDSSPDIP